MFDEVNYAGLGFTIKDKVLSAIEDVVGFGVFGGLKNFINLDWICFVIVFDSEQEDGGKQDIQEDTDDKNGTAEELAAGRELAGLGWVGLGH